MRKLCLLVTLVVAVGLLAPCALAFDWPDNIDTLWEGAIEDRSSIYRDNVPIELETIPQIGDEQRSVFVVNQLDLRGSVVPGDPGGWLTPSIEANFPHLSYQPKSLSGLLFDANVINVALLGPTTVDLDFGPGGRYADAASGGGTDGTWTDTNPGTGGFLATTAGGFGALLVIYEDDLLSGNVPIFAGDGIYGGDAGPGLDGQADWRTPGDVSGTSPHPGAATMAIPGVLTNSDYFPTMSDVAGTAGPGDSGLAVPFLVCVLAPLDPVAAAIYGCAAGTVLTEQDFDLLSTGAGLAYANIIGGYAASYFETDLFGLGRDIRLDFEMDAGYALEIDGWQVISDDPVQFGTIPEPATLSLLGLGLLGVAIRRKKK